MRRSDDTILIAQPWEALGVAWGEQRAEGKKDGEVHRPAGPTQPKNTHESHSHTQGIGIAL